MYFTLHRSDKRRCAQPPRCAGMPRNAAPSASAGPWQQAHHLSCCSRSWRSRTLARARSKARALPLSRAASSTSGLSVTGDAPLLAPLLRWRAVPSTARPVPPWSRGEETPHWVVWEASASAHAAGGGREGGKGGRKAGAAAAAGVVGGRAAGGASGTAGCCCCHSLRATPPSPLLDCVRPPAEPVLCMGPPRAPPLSPPLPPPLPPRPPPPLPPCASFFLASSLSCRSSASRSSSVASRERCCSQPDSESEVGGSGRTWPHGAVRREGVK